MNTLEDLRETLGRHADDVADPAAVARTAAVHHRVAVVRRRRRTVGTGAVALALVAGAAVAVWPRSAREPAPAGPVVLGQRAPATLGSLGYTYDATGRSQVVHGSGTVVVPRSRTPQLLSWTTDRPATVTFVLPGHEVHRTRVTGFGDFLLLPAGVESRVRVRAAGTEVGVATYALGDRAPAGVTGDGLTYRKVVAGTHLLAARFGEPGATSVTLSYRATGGPVSVGVMCTALPHGAVVNVSFDRDGAVSAGACDSDGTFDPGASSLSQLRPGHRGQTVEVRAWLSPGFHDSTPLAAGSVAGLRLGLGVYGPVAQRPLGGTRVPTVVESGGHTWRLVGRTTHATDAPLRVPGAPVDRIATLAWHTHGHTVLTFGVDGETPTGSSSTGGSGALPDLWVPAGAEVRASASKGHGSYGIATYERVD
jgi:hypothetical protein